ncbi:MAG UNVERIFIED_CONTAM: hypothetical protein LVT10_15815 [Anaerolineae bacterium]
MRHATLGDVPALAEMNRMLRQDELSPRTKDLVWLTERMQDWITKQVYTVVCDGARGGNDRICDFSHRT